MPPRQRRAPPHRALSANMCRQRLAASTRFLTPVRRLSRLTWATVRRRWPSTCASAADSASVPNLPEPHPPARTMQADRLLEARLRAAAVVDLAVAAAVVDLAVAAAVVVVAAEAAAL